LRGDDARSKESEKAGMINAAIASANPTTAGHLRACLQQTGLVQSVTEWNPSLQGEWEVRSKESIPEVVVLDIDRDPTMLFAFAAHLRRLNPTVHIIACSPHDPGPELLLEAMRSGVREFLSSAVETATLRRTLQQFVKESTGTGLEVIRKVIVVMGAKGGVGTSTLAVNLGVQIAAVKHKRTILLDLGQPVGHASLLLDLRPRFTIRDGLENLESLDSHFFCGLLTKHDTGLEVLAGIGHPEHWQQISVPGVSRILNVAQSIADFVVVDFGAPLSPDWREVLNQARTILVVAQADVPSLWSLERQITAMADLDREPDRIRIVINRWSRRDDPALKSLEKSLKRFVFARLPNDFGQVSEATNRGIPLFKNHNNPLLTQVRQLATQLIGESGSTTAPPRLQRSGINQLLTFSKAR
jgi:pilus assembly protein CpaE